MQNSPFEIGNPRINHEENVVHSLWHCSSKEYNKSPNINICYRISVDGFLSNWNQTKILSFKIEIQLLQKFLFDFINMNTNNQSTCQRFDIAKIRLITQICIFMNGSIRSISAYHANIHCWSRWQWIWIRWRHDNWRKYLFWHWTRRRWRYYWRKFCVCKAKKHVWDWENSREIDLPPEPVEVFVVLRVRIGSAFVFARERERTRSVQVS